MKLKLNVQPSEMSPVHPFGVIATIIDIIGETLQKTAFEIGKTNYMPVQVTTSTGFPTKI